MSSAVVDGPSLARRRYPTSPLPSAPSAQPWPSLSSTETTPDSFLVSNSSHGSIIDKIRAATLSSSPSSIDSRKQRILDENVVDDNPRTMDEQEQDEVIDALTCTMETNALKWRIAMTIMIFLTLVVYTFLPLPRLQDYAPLPIPHWLCSRTMIITELFLSLLAAYSEILTSLPDTSHTDVPPDDLTPTMIETARRKAHHGASLERVRSCSPSPSPSKSTNPFHPPPELTAVLRASKQHKLEINAALFKWYARMPRLYKDAAKSAPNINLKHLLRMRWPLNIARVPAFARAVVLLVAVLLPVQVQLLVAPFVPVFDDDARQWTSIAALPFQLSAFILGLSTAGRNYIDEMDADMNRLKKLKYENKGA